MSKSLADILKKSKAIMGHDSLQIKEKNKNVEKEIPEFKVSESLSKELKNSSITESNIKNSKLPDSIKEAMMATPIDIPNPFDVEGNPEYAELLEENTIIKTPKKETQLIGESKNSGLSESVIRFIVKEEIQKALKEVKKPVISESQLQRAMVKMIKEGKLSIKKK